MPAAAIVHQSRIISPLLPPLLLLVFLLLLSTPLISSKPRQWTQWSHEEQELETARQEEVGVEVSESTRSAFPLYHFRMINDAVRNEAFYNAIKVLRLQTYSHTRTHTHTRAHKK